MAQPQALGRDGALATARTLTLLSGYTHTLDSRPRDLSQHFAIHGDALHYMQCRSALASLGPYGSARARWTLSQRKIKHRHPPPPAISRPTPNHHPTLQGPTRVPGTTPSVEKHLIDSSPSLAHELCVQMHTNVVGAVKRCGIKRHRRTPIRTKHSCSPARARPRLRSSPRRSRGSSSPPLAHELRIQLHANVDRQLTTAQDLRVVARAREAVAPAKSLGPPGGQKPPNPRRRTRVQCARLVACPRPRRTRARGTARPPSRF
ncbi:hypothetical protein CERSUDRAFT_99446 [Gelatoporia subvermispora B]|uniref:Uncharacterized protein n=1 Tax=Ceriporiopsis subvermispora (strain B) TaxID=914234 RepID=M2Q6A0_CERS8|nr:hypothetical protein CERSUDRAFT_99446 [Gelatoporia subvermispora B]